MSGVYWGLTSMFLMNKQDMMEKDEIIEFVKSCQHENGGFSASHNHDPHLLYTLSAIQVCWTETLHKIFLEFHPNLKAAVVSVKKNLLGN